MLKINISKNYKRGIDYCFENNIDPIHIFGIKNEGIIQDIRDPLIANSIVYLIQRGDPEGLDILRHSMAHLMAQALKRLYPTIQLGIGPHTNNGFYYDFSYKTPLTPNNFNDIQKEMTQIIKDNIIITKYIKTKNEIEKICQDREEYLKIKILNNISVNTLTYYEQGDFGDLCKGPHVYSTGSIGDGFKLYNVGGIHSADNIQRIYAYGFFSMDDLIKMENKIANAPDHKKIGQQMDLFVLNSYSTGAVFWQPLGFKLFENIQKYIRNKLTKHNYQEVKTPIIYNCELWKKSGHWSNFKDNMFVINDKYGLKPMNCPAHMIIFGSKTRSYKNLPLRFSEFGCCNRNESSGSMNGLSRLREFVQDDGHIFCTYDQLFDEINNFCQLVYEIYKDMKFNNIIVKVSTKPDNSLGSEEKWQVAESILFKSLKSLNINYDILPGEGAFYGPKIEFSLEDSLGRLWQCGTIQVDMILPERMGIFYINEQNKKEIPIVLHRAALGSMERFISILLENGSLPLHIHPQAIGIIPVSQTHINFCNDIKDILDQNHITNKILDIGSVKQRTKIIWEKKYVLGIVIGDKEMDENQITFKWKDQKISCLLDELGDCIKKHVA